MVVLQTAVHAFRATLGLAERTPTERMPVVDVSEDLGVTGNDLSKVLHVLGRGGVRVAYRGPGSGFSLGRAPDSTPTSIGDC